MSVIRLMIYLIDVIVIYIQSDKVRSMKQIEDQWQCSLHIRVEMERLEGGVKDNMFDPSLADKVDVGDQRMKYLSELQIFLQIKSKTYNSHRAVAMARRKEMTVDWAEHDVVEETMSAVRILFVRNLMLLSTTEATLRNLFTNINGEKDSMERVEKF